MNKMEIIKELARADNNADISCIVVVNGEVFTYTQDEADGKTLLALARAIKRKATIHVTG